MRGLTVNNQGAVEVDPFNKRGEYERWRASIVKDGAIDYCSLRGVSAAHSEAITRYVLDQSTGKNTARGQRKGARSYVHLVHLRFRLVSILRMFENYAHKKQLDFTEDDVITVFQGMREGRIFSMKGKPFLDVRSYAKVFSAFWRWHIRVQRKDSITVTDVVESLDTSADHKPAWSHFTIKDLERMCENAPTFEYRALMMLLFDSGIRAPKELMNVRAMDLTPVPGSQNLFLNIREETSKTFGRKIKLMLCSDLIRKYIEDKKLQPTDFLFKLNPITYNRTLGRIGYKILHIGTPHTQRTNGYAKKILIRNGITMYDFRHNSVCHYLPIYKSENQMKYRYGWKKSDMIHYYSELIGMRDTITDDDLLVDTTKAEIQQQLAREQQKVQFLSEQFDAQKVEMEDKMKRLEALMMQQFSNNFRPNTNSR